MKIFKSIIRLTFVLFALLGFTACSMDEADEGGRTITSTKDYVLTIASHKVPSLFWSGNSNTLCDMLAAKEESSADWTQHPSIEGFEYEEGFEYKIKVRETCYLDYSMGDPSWAEYKMTELISKEKKHRKTCPHILSPIGINPDKVSAFNMQLKQMTKNGLKKI